MAPTLARCGCHQLATLAGAGATDFTRPALIQAAKDSQRAQRCPVAGFAGDGFDEDGVSGYARAAQDFAETTGSALATTCPLACLYGRAGHVEELLNAMGAAADYHVPMAETLGRPLAAVDVDAIAAFRAARANRDAAEQRMIQSERQAQADAARENRERGAP